MSLRLSAALGTSPEFWLKMQGAVRSLARPEKNAKGAAISAPGESPAGSGS
jgi:plasmid maintenance system antidote protein VapI